MPREPASRRLSRFLAVVWPMDSGRRARAANGKTLGGEDRLRRLPGRPSRSKPT
jgi:hypothetical protein